MDCSSPGLKVCGRRAGDGRMRDLRQAAICQIMISCGPHHSLSVSLQATDLLTMFPSVLREIIFERSFSSRDWTDGERWTGNLLPFPHLSNYIGPTPVYGKSRTMPTQIKDREMRCTILSEADRMTKKEGVKEEKTFPQKTVFRHGTCQLSMETLSIPIGESHGNGVYDVKQLRPITSEQWRCSTIQSVYALSLADSKYEDTILWDDMIRESNIKIFDSNW
ncbi:hypothetical protein LSTR_LSTR006972 [Laodelphax striatellus]|uniref:Uncharacterized protein n=1 Tax=Laodelphax striatellus TaxID=195883 RepID=A0A482WPK3_LAOST|nr:hypothetical protein LSTR_LSTR006972 [Laodelphax striatellus]